MSLILGALLSPARNSRFCDNSANSGTAAAVAPVALNRRRQGSRQPRGRSTRLRLRGPSELETDPGEKQFARATIIAVDRRVSIANYAERIRHEVPSGVSAPHFNPRADEVASSSTFAQG